MKNLWKFAAALAVIAGAVVIIARFGTSSWQSFRACGISAAVSVAAPAARGWRTWPVKRPMRCTRL